MNRIKEIVSELKTVSGAVIFLVTTVVFFTITYYVNDFELVGVTFLFHLPKKIFIPYLTFVFINTALVGMSAVLFVKRVKVLRKIGLLSGGGVSLIGSVFGLLSGACPGCIAGLFPIVMGAIGYSSFTLVGLPLYGLEFQILSTGLMVFGIYMLSKPVVCKVDDKKVVK